MTFSIIVRLLETFFRRWYFYLVPFVAIVGLGFSNVSSTPTEYSSAGSITTSNASLLSELTEVGTGTPFTFETAASLTSRKISSLLGTDAFARKVAEGAGAGPALQSGAITLGAIRFVIATYPAGDELLTVRATTVDPELSRRLAESTIDNYIEEVIDVELTQAQTAETVLKNRLDRHQQELDDARAEFGRYVVEHEAPPLGAARPVDEQLMIDQLTSTVERADTQLAETLNQYEEAQLVTEQTRADIAQRIRVIDAPQKSLVPEPTTRTTVLTMGLFTILGALVTIALVAVVTVLDHTVRREADIEALVGLDVVATVPKRLCRHHEHVHARTRNGGAVSKKRGAKGRPATDLTTGVRSDGGLAIVEFGGQLLHTAPAGVTSSLRYLLTRLQLNDPDEIPRRLAITSALHGEGVSYITRSLAAVMAHDLERMVCVVDMNWWSGGRSDSTTLGLADVVLRGHATDEVLVETVTENLWFMPAGTVELAGRPALAKDPRLATTLDDLERQFDHLLFDLPAVLATSDAIALARFADVYALVVRYGVTTTAQVRSALDELAGMPSIGLIVNRSDSSIPKVVRRLVGI